MMVQLAIAAVREFACPLLSRERTASRSYSFLLVVSRCQRAANFANKWTAAQRQHRRC